MSGPCPARAAKRRRTREKDPTATRRPDAAEAEASNTAAAPDGLTAAVRERVQRLRRRADKASRSGDVEKAARLTDRAARLLQAATPRRPATEANHAPPSLASCVSPEQAPVGAVESGLSVRLDKLGVRAAKAEAAGDVAKAARLRDRARRLVAAASAPPPPPHQPRPRNDSASNESGGEDVPLEGVMQDGTLYLVDPTGGVFRSERNTEGELVRVGSRDAPSGRLLLDLKKDRPTVVAEDDHCETPQLAYTHLKPVLEQLASRLGKKPADLSVYDPYFCAGGVVDRLAAVGFPSVYNKCEDFYARVEAQDFPEHDVLVTNPPYSGDHVERLLRHCKRSGRPFALLMPNWVYRKSYFTKLFPSGVWYLVPKRRYVYLPPSGARAKKASDTQRKTSPFVSFWYIHLGAKHDEPVVSWWRSHCTGTVAVSAVPRGGAGAGAGAGVAAGSGSTPAACGAGVVLARGARQLPVQAMDGNDPARKKARDRARRNKRKRKAT